MFFAILSLFFGSVETLLMDYFFRIYDPVLFIALFYVFAFLITLGLAIRNKEKIDISQAINHKRVLLWFVGTSAIGNGLWFSALYLMGSHGVVIMSILQRAFILYYSTHYMNEKMTKIQYLLSGLIIICTIFFTSQESNTELLGGFICLLSYVFFAINDIAQKKVAERVAWQTAMTLRQFVQCLLFVIISVIYCFYQNIDLINTINISFVFHVFITSLCGAVLGKLFHFQALKNIPLSRVLLIEQLRAAFVFGGAVLFLGAVSDPIQLISGIIMVVAVFCVAYEDYRLKLKK